jgi:hypothetical protein
MQWFEYPEDEGSEKNGTEIACARSRRKVTKVKVRQLCTGGKLH